MIPTRDELHEWVFCEDDISFDHDEELMLECSYAASTAYVNSGIHGENVVNGLDVSMTVDELVDDGVVGEWLVFATDDEKRRLWDQIVREQGYAD